MVEGIPSVYYEIMTGFGPAHIHIDYIGKKILNIFVNLPPLGTEISTDASILGIVLSKYFESSGGNPDRILKHLNGAKGDRPHTSDGETIFSIPHAVAVALKRWKEKVKSEDKQEEISVASDNGHNGNGQSSGTGHEEPASGSAPALTQHN